MIAEDVLTDSNIIISNKFSQEKNVYLYNSVELFTLDKKQNDTKNTIIMSYHKLANFITPVFKSGILFLQNVYIAFSVYSLKNILPLFVTTLNHPVYRLYLFSVFFHK